MPASAVARQTRRGQGSIDPTKTQAPKIHVCPATVAYSADDEVKLMSQGRTRPTSRCAPGARGSLILGLPRLVWVRLVSALR